MEKIDKIIAEEIKYFKYNFRITEATNVNGIDYAVGSFDNLITFAPKTYDESVEFEKNKSKNIKAIEKMLNKKSKAQFIQDNRYKGYGVAFKLDVSSFIKDLK